MELSLKSVYLRFLFLFAILASLIKSDEELIKNSKVLSCVSLARGAIKHEKEYIQSLASGFKNTDPSEISSKILTLLIVKCFRKIRSDQSFELLTQLNSQKNKELEWRAEFRDLLGLDKEITSDIDTEGFLEDFKEVNRILVELNDEAKTIKESMNDNNNKKGSEAKKPNKHNERPKSKSSESEKSYLSLITQPLLLFFNGISSLIGFDSFFGVGIMIFLIFILSYSLRVLLTGRGKPAEKKRKTNINKEVKKEN